MALNTFGWTPAEVTTDSAGNVISGVTLTVFTDVTKATQVTGLMDKDGVTPLANNVVVSDNKGRFGFKASDAYSLLYVYDGSTADPWPIAAHEALDAGAATHAQAVADAQAAADSAAQSASLVSAPADTVMATTVNNAASETRKAMTAAFAPIGEGFRTLRAAAIGTSIMAGGLRSTDGVVVQVGNTWAPMGAAGVQQGGPQSWFTYACLLSAGRLAHHFNASIASDTMQNAITRFQADVVAKDPEVCFLGDPTNEINNAATDAQIRDRVDQLVKLARAAGITPILTTATPQNDAAKGQRVREHNVWVRRYAAANQVHLVDPYAALVDPASTTGQYIAGYTADGLHPNTAGALAAGQKVLADLSGILRGNTAPGSALFLPQDRVANPNLFVNPLMQDDVNADGKADSWTALGTTCTLETDPAVLGKAQKIVISSATGYLYQQKSVDGVAFSVGDRIAYSGMAKVSAGGSLVWQPSITMFGVSTPYNVQPIAAGNADMPWFAYHCEAVIPTGATFFRPGLFTNAGVGTMWAAQQRLVNLTKLGIA